MAAIYARVMERLEALRTEEGASLVEYALLVVLIALVAIIAISLVGENVSKAFDTVGKTLGSAPN